MPGPAGAAGGDGADGINGVSAFTTLAANFTMPAQLGSGNATFTSAAMFTSGETIYLQGAGTLQITAIAGNVVTLKNLRDDANAVYAPNVAAGTVIASGAQVVPTGIQGPSGSAAAAGAPSGASFWTRVAEAGLSSETALGLLATGLVRNTTVTGVPTIAVDGTHYLSPLTGLMPADIGASVQAWAALLDAIAGAGSAADRLAYYTGANAAAITPFTAFGRSLVDDSSAVNARVTMGLGNSIIDTYYAEERQGSGTAGGDFNNGSWQTRLLNTEVYDSNNVGVLAANQVTLQAGTYQCMAWAIGYRVDSHQIRIENITSGTTVAFGASARAAAGVDIPTLSVAYGRTTIVGARTFELQHQCQTTRAADGRGVACSFGNQNIYAGLWFGMESD